MREYSHGLCEKDVTFGADNKGRLWTDGGCDGRFQVCYTTKNAGITILIAKLAHAFPFHNVKILYKL